MNYADCLVYLESSPTYMQKYTITMNDWSNKRIITIATDDGEILDYLTNNGAPVVFSNNSFVILSFD